MTYDSQENWSGERTYRAQQKRKRSSLDTQRTGDSFLEDYGFLDADVVAETISGVNDKAHKELWTAMYTVTSRSDWEKGRYNPPSLEEVWRYLSPATKAHLKSLNFDA
ncbi:hypothetical protein LCGC14_2677520 [marine sediment metagenome]|uniref:Uncharacterized protein n=1 Tax=marine sediment metagenome TaxID=412755 RepID=A0A0F9A9V7_9ZZZZ